MSAHAENFLESRLFLSKNENNFEVEVLFLISLAMYITFKGYFISCDWSVCFYSVSHAFDSLAVCKSLMLTKHLFVEHRVQHSTHFLHL